MNSVSATRGHFKEFIIPIVESYYGLATVGEEAIIRKVKALSFHGAFLYTVRSSACTQ